MAEHNRIIKEIWDLRRQQEPRSDPMVVLPPELIHQIFMETVHWFDIKCGMEAFRHIPHSNADMALTLWSVSQKWRDFVLNDAPLWSQILIDTDNPDSSDRLQLYLHLSQPRNLFIVLQGWKPASGILLEQLMEASHRISILVHPYDRPLIRLDDMTSTIRDSPSALCPFIELMVYSQSHTPKPPKSFFYPPFIHTLRLYGNCRYSTLSALLSFQLLSELSVDIFPPEVGAVSLLQMPIVLPRLRTLILVIRWWSEGHWQLSKLFTCPSLKALHLNAPLQIDHRSLRAFIVMLHDLPFFPDLESLKLIIHMVLGNPKSLSIRNQSWLHESLGNDTRPQVPNTLRSISFNLVRNRLKPIYAPIWEKFEGVFIQEMTPLTELITSQFRDIHLPFLRRLYLHGLPQESPSIIVTFPCLELLEIQPVIYDRFILLEQIRAPNLQRLHIKAPKYRGPCQRTSFNCRDITRSTVSHISVQMDSKDRILTFWLPSSVSLVVRGWTELHLLDPPPTWYSLEVGIIGTDYLPLRLDALKASVVTRLKDAFGGVIGTNIHMLTRLTSLQKISLGGNAHRITSPSSALELLKLLAKDFRLCPFITSITLSEYPSNWESFLSALRIRNCAGLLDKRTSIIRSLEFLGGLHQNIVECLREAIHGKFVTLTSPPSRGGRTWPARPIKKTNDLYRSCYLCHISGFELGCMQFETQVVDCGRERGEGVVIRAI